MVCTHVHVLYAIGVTSDYNERRHDYVLHEAEGLKSFLSHVYVSADLFVELHTNLEHKRLSV